MTMAANLEQAAYLSYSQGSLAWYGLTFPAKFAAFITDVSPLFEDSVPNDRPVGNWLVPMYALSQTLTGALPSLAQFNAAVTYLYRICLGALYANQQLLITNAQAIAMLAAWNTRFGT